jgi:hypothetical protein
VHAPRRESSSPRRRRRGDMASTDNPLQAATEDVEAVLVKAGLVAPERAAELATVLDQLLSRREQQWATAARAEAEAIAEAKVAEITNGSGGSHIADATVQSMIVAHLSTNPANFHQCVSFFAASDEPEDAAMHARAPVLYLGSLLMVLLQLFTALSAWKGTFFPSCSANPQCGTGRWCRMGSTKSCTYCGDDIPLSRELHGDCAFQIDKYGDLSTIDDPACSTYNFPRDPNFVGFNTATVQSVCAEPDGRMGGVIAGSSGRERLYVRADVASWCESCVHVIDFAVDDLNQPRLIVGNLDVMVSLDILSLFFTVFVISCTVVGELKDIQLCKTGANHAARKLSQPWRLALAFVCYIRRWMFLPFLLSTIPLMLMYKGADTLSICFNTIVRPFTILDSCASTSRVADIVARINLP